MERLKGKAVYRGIALGRIRVFKKKELLIEQKNIQNTDEELDRVKEAKRQAYAQLQELYAKALKEVGKDHAAIIQGQQLMLEDEDFQEAIENIICSQRINGEYAVFQAGKEFTQMFSAMDDEYMKARAADVQDITERILKCLSKSGIEGIELDEPAILVAQDLSPSETIVLDKRKILALVTVQGSANSHTAILARSMNIPALVGVNMNLETLLSGTEAAVDGFQGEFIVKPDEKIKKEFLVRITKENERQKMLKELKGKENITSGGKKINLYANVGSIEEVKCALENDAGGIGLFRSEFLYIGRNSLPGEEEQFQIYKQAAEEMGDKKVIIRTVDIGADKQADYLQFSHEKNPALGYRAIRICLTRTDIFKTQLRALYRASVYGNIAIMYPMIISTEEVNAVKKITEEVKMELTDEKIPYKDVEEGIMIETPAAALISDELAEMVDFFSIGTNDLTQYTLAIDRQNEKLDSFYNARHTAVLKLIQITTDNAHKAGKWVGICGELAADMKLTETFIKMGIDELSVAPASILELRQIIRQIQ